MTEIAEYFGKDPSWAVAAEIVRGVMGRTHGLWRLSRQTWQGVLTEDDFVNMVGVTKCPLVPLLNAAGIPLDAEGKPQKDLKSLTQAVTTLGCRYASVVLGTSIALFYVKRCSDEPISLKISKELMTCVEVGYHMGAKVFGLGPEYGALMGLGTLIGECVITGLKPRETRTWWKDLPKERKSLIKKNFGCDSYQVAALALQTLGFGPEVACGIVLANCRRDAIPNTFPDAASVWQSTYDWVDALRYGKNYPALESSRKRFKELIPTEPGSGQRNLVLEALYAEIARLRTDGSDWKWF